MSGGGEKPQAQLSARNFCCLMRADRREYIAGTVAVLMDACCRARPSSQSACFRPSRKARPVLLVAARFGCDRRAAGDCGNLREAWARTVRESRRAFRLLWASIANLPAAFGKFIRMEYTLHFILGAGVRFGRDFAGGQINENTRGRVPNFWWPLRPSLFHSVPYLRRGIKLSALPGRRENLSGGPV